VSTVSAGPSLAQAFVAAAEAIGRVSGGESLNAALADLKSRAPARTLAAAAQDLCYNALRGYGVVDVALERLLQKPLTDSPVRGLLLTALAELAARRTPRTRSCIRQWKRLFCSGTRARKDWSTR